MKRNYIAQFTTGIQAVSLPAGEYPLQLKGHMQNLFGPVFRPLTDSDMTTAQQRARQWVPPVSPPRYD